MPQYQELTPADIWTMLQSIPAYNRDDWLSRPSPDASVAALNSTRITGKSDEEILTLVVKLEAARKTAK